MDQFTIEMNIQSSLQIEKKFNEENNFDNNQFNNHIVSTSNKRFKKGKLISDFFKITNKSYSGFQQQ